MEFRGSRRSGVLGLSCLAVGAIASVSLFSETDLARLTFVGHFREGCKTAQLSARVETFRSVSDLRQTLLVPDAQMLQSYPDIDSPQGAPNGRVIEEDHVVQVTALLLAVKFEDGRNGGSGDNDFHIIIGDSPADPASLLNVEASGLPRAGDPGQKFERVRRELLSILAGANIKPVSSFRKFSPPIKVTVTGSLYFDADHKAGQVGPSGLRPTTVWEIHPIHDLQLLPKGESLPTGADRSNAAIEKVAASALTRRSKGRPESLSRFRGSQRDSKISNSVLSTASVQNLKANEVLVLDADDAGVTFALSADKQRWRQTTLSAHTKQTYRGYHYLELRNPPYLDDYSIVWTHRYAIAPTPSRGYRLIDVTEP